MLYSLHQLTCFAHQLMRDSMDRMAGALLDAQVDLNPHQIDAAFFAASNPLSKGEIPGVDYVVIAGLTPASGVAETVAFYAKGSTMPNKR